MLSFATARDQILISCQPILKLKTHYGFHELFNILFIKLSVLLSEL